MPKSLPLIKKLFCSVMLFISSQCVLAEPVNSLRIISVDSNATELLQALGVGQQIIAADITSEPLLKGQKVEKLGYHRALSAEALLALQPDLIIGSDHTGPAPTIKAIQNADINFIQLQSPENIADVVRNIQILSAELDKKSKGDQVIADIQQLEKSITNRVKNNGDLNMVFLLSLNDRGFSQAGRDTVGNALITILKGSNISEFNGYQSVSLESILAMNPDVILVGLRSNGAPKSEQLLSRYPLLAHTSAGKHQRIIGIDASSLIAGLSMDAIEQADRVAEMLTKSSQ